jgi:hypothetical protein
MVDVEIAEGGCGCSIMRVDRGLFKEDGVNRLSVSGDVEEMDKGGGVGRSAW